MVDEKEMIEFSAVVQTYNRGPLLSETLEAVRRQRCAAAEVLVIDDGSTDDTEDRIKREFPEFIYIRIDNSGAGAARKAGADCASKEWIAFCDDDDLWLPDHLERRAGLIRRFPQAGFTFSNFRAFGPAAKANYIHFDCTPPGWWETAAEILDDDLILINRHAFRHFLNFNPAYPLTWAIRRDVYSDLGGINPRYSRWQAEDGEFLRRCALGTPVAGDRRVTALYRRHDGNKSRSQIGNLLWSAEIISEQLEAGIIPPEYYAETKECISNKRKEAYLTAFWNRDFSSMSDIFTKYAEVRKDWRLLARHLIVKASRRFRSVGFH